MFSRLLLLLFYFMPSRMCMFLSHLASRARCGIRLYRFQIIAFSSTMHCLPSLMHLLDALLEKPHSLNLEITCNYPNIWTDRSGQTMQTKIRLLFVTKKYIPNHFLFGSTLATVPDASQDWKGAGRIILPAESLKRVFGDNLEVFLHKNICCG